ncbi:RCC1 domain-containing protein [Psychrobacillus sp. FSL K6-1464]|uniref:RCC1 domain-containing protein n=1 Tax=Psychrobacillus sp. FSL K6-1464 TaxID=2921545 RepID=UPI0030F58061
MKKETNKQYRARNVLFSRFIKTFLASSLLLSGAATTIGPTGLSLSHMQVAEAAIEQGIFDVIVSGYNHSLAITSDGSVYSWGNNQKGQLGDGTKINKTIPTKVNGLSDVVAVDARGMHSLAITSDGSVYTWGNNDSGQLGDGMNTSYNPVPTKINGLSNAVAIKAGDQHSFAILSDGSVYGWGYNVHGQLGDGTEINKRIPTRISNLSDVVSVEAGVIHSLALKSNGSVYAWGWNHTGQLGDGKTTPRSTPTIVNGLSDVVSVKAGNNFSLALTSDGSVYSWGENNYGQLGNGTTTQKNTATKINGLSEVIAVEAGRQHSLAITSDGSVYAWGYNASGELGDGTTSNKTAPTKVSGLSNVVEVKTGNSYSLAITSDGSVYAWGYNAMGQLGDGTIANKNRPTLLADIKVDFGGEAELKELIAMAIASVEKSENTKLQPDLDASRSLVNALPDSKEKTALTERLNVVQDTIDGITASYEEMMAELVDMKAYLLTGEGSKADVLAMREALNDILNNSKSLLNDSHRSEVAHTIQDVLDIIGLLEIIWDKIASGELAGLDELVTQLPESTLKDNTKQEVEATKADDIDASLAEATTSVEKAEQFKLQADVNTSRSLVNSLPDGTEKTALTVRLNIVQKTIDDAKAIATQIAQATTSVKKAEGSKIQADIDVARSLVESLPNVSEKTTLIQRLNAIVVTPEGAELLKEAQETVEKLNDQSTKEQVAGAKELVAKLPESPTKTRLSEGIATIEANQKAMNAVAQAEKMQTSYNITLAEKAINQLSDGPLKTELSERIQQLKLTLDAESKVKSAELTKREPYITEAKDSIAKLKDSPKKTELANRMKVIRDALAAEVEVALLEEAIAHVVLAEQHKRDPYLTSAKDLVSKLKEGTDKTALENRLKAIQDAAPVKPEAPVVDPALLKAAETQVSYAERYKRDPYLTRAQEAVGKLPTSEVKAALQDRLDILSSGASDQVEATKLKTATDSVTIAESASDLFVIEEARSLVNGLKDGEAKQVLVDRLDAIEVTEAMQFAYDLKAEIEAITDATIKKALQEAYTAVGVAKERQTSTYMTKASKSIEALSKYTATQSEVIEKLSTFFTDMQKELEMQKLIVAANNAVALAEKYKRAPYFAKAQAAIDVLSEGKAKADLQARHDAVMN